MSETKSAPQTLPQAPQEKPSTTSSTTRTANPTEREPLWRDALGECLRRARHERGEILSETADRAGISPQYLSEMERGLKEPSSEMIAAVAGALDTSLADLTLEVARGLQATQIGAVRSTGSQTAYMLAA